MSPGDFVITATGRRTITAIRRKKPMLWLDVLDFPAVNFFEASFAEYFDDEMQNTTAATAIRCVLRLGRVARRRAGTMNRSPVINYTYARTRPILDRMKKAGEIDKRHGARVRYVNPVNGGPVLPTMGAKPRAVARRASRASPTARPTAPSSSAPKAAAPPRSATRCWNGARTTCSSCRRGSGITTGGEGVGAVLDLRPSGAGSAGHLARGQITRARNAGGIPPVAISGPTTPVRQLLPVRSCRCACYNNNLRAFGDDVR